MQGRTLQFFGGGNRLISAVCMDPDVWDPGTLGTIKISFQRINLRWDFHATGFPLTIFAINRAVEDKFQPWRP